MEPINEIGVPNVTIPQVKQSDWIYGIPFIPNNDPPVTLQIGFPIVDMPGCVKMHKDNKDHVTRLPFDKDLVNQDEKGSTTLCPHGEYPTYDAMDYQPENLLVTQETPPPAVQPPPTPPEFTPEAIPETETEVACPGPGQLRVGDVTQSGDERVVGHQLSANGKVCETLYEPTTPLEKYVPPINQVTSVTALAVVATAGAAATPLLIRIIRPVIKKLWTTLQKKLGKGKKKEEQTSEQIAKKYKMKKLVITD
mgnify:FL=1